MVIMGELSNLLDAGSRIGQSCEDGTNISTILHGNDAELILFVDPAKEGLGIVVEDATAGGPVTVETAGLEEAIALLEQEVVLDQLLLIGLAHGSQGVVLAGELTSEGLESLLGIDFDLVTLFLADSGAKRELGEVAADTDAGALDHLGVLLSEGWALELGVVHVADVLGVLAVAVVGLNDGVEERTKLLVALMGASVATDARVNVLAAREDAGLKIDTAFVFLVVKLIPNLLGQVHGEG
jgi:hypothetical protein